ncbi:PREDICTED: signaling threshold-regulating transmembrane adapter 1 [Condylura cristata]|uniref:signaling threshold-regulating transmembrane adapter 1 n=1 Tax=Condylura cristata TaxID=143302 RepID=UPI000643904F|nr:PREDICTED: signaling threshold-regulating transmembrane adapter 1 [Condylura cristata]
MGSPAQYHSKFRPAYFFSDREASNFATTSIGDAELWGLSPRRGGNKGDCGSCQVMNITPDLTFLYLGLLGAVTLLFLISMAAHLSRWTRSRSRSKRPPGQDRSGESAEEVPLYGNLHYLQTGRLSQEPQPDQQDPIPGGPGRTAEEVMCYTSLQLRRPQGRIPSPGTAIKYSEVVLDSEPKPQDLGPELELYASVCAQTRRARASFPDQAYANSQPAPS